MTKVNTEDRICWWCENGFDDSPEYKYEMVIHLEESMHRICKQAHLRSEKIRAELNVDHE
jgi:hypothetical protein